jgi:predicted lipoprotein
MTIKATTKKLVLAAAALAGVALLLYHSVYVESLSERQLRQQFNSFDPQQLVDYFLRHELDKRLAKSLDFDTFTAELSSHPQQLAEQHGRKAGIGDRVCFLVKGRAVVEELSGDEASFTVDGTRYFVPLRRIFSNTARDAIGYFDIGSFDNTMDYNTISTTLNRRLVADVLAGKDTALHVGSELAFSAAVEVNVAQLPPTEVEVVVYKWE